MREITLSVLLSTGDIQLKIVTEETIIAEGATFDEVLASTHKLAIGVTTGEFEHEGRTVEVNEFSVDDEPNATTYYNTDHVVSITVAATE